MEAILLSITQISSGKHHYTNLHNRPDGSRDLPPEYPEVKG